MVVAGGLLVTYWAELQVIHTAVVTMEYREHVPILFLIAQFVEVGESVVVYLLALPAPIHKPRDL